MSGLKVASINHPSAGSGGLAISTSGLVSGAGLDLIVSQTFTAVSSVSVNNCFSSSYDNYRIVVEAIGSTATQGCPMRLRASGVDNSAASYSFVRAEFDTTYSSSKSTSGTSAEAIVVDSAGKSLLVLDIFSPARAAATAWTGHGRRSPSNIGQNISGYHSAASSFDGFSLIPSTGTITGTLRVYGYRN